jgi:hypothetical protein
MQINVTEVSRIEAAAVTMTEAMSKLYRILSHAEYCAFCDRVFGNWG